MRTFEELVGEAEAGDVTGWGFGRLEGRATEERPPWGFARLLADRLTQVRSALDIDTGGGEVIAEAPVLPATMVVTEGWPTNAERARRLLGPRGVHVVETDGGPLPFPDSSFELVTARHPVSPDWAAEIRRVLQPGGGYLAQHVGPASAFELIEYFLGSYEPKGREPVREVAAAQREGLELERRQRARCRMEFHDVGTIVWILRKCVWWVRDFSVARYEEQLHELDAQMRHGHPFVAHFTRHHIQARLLTG